MTRTRQSSAQKTRGASNRENTSVQKPKTSPATPKTPPTISKTQAKGRYGCGQCKKFEGPRRAVEDHCRERHKLTGERLQKAVKLTAELRRDLSGPCGEQASPQRTSKRPGNMPVNQDTNEDAKSPKRKKVAAKQTDSSQREGDKSLSSSSPVANVRSGKRTSAGESQSSPPISTSLPAQGTPEGTCEKCKRTFPRPRQLSKHKCFPVVEKKSIKPEADSGDYRQSPLRSQRNIREAARVEEINIPSRTRRESPGPGKETNRLTEEKNEKKTNTLRTGESVSIGDEVIDSGQGDAAMDSQRENVELPQTLEGAKSVSNGRRGSSHQMQSEAQLVNDGSARRGYQESFHNLSSDSEAHFFLVDIKTEVPEKTDPPEELPQKPETTGMTSGTSETISDSSGTRHSCLLPVPTLLKPQGTPESTCGKCKRTFSRARQLIKHKCFAVENDKPEPKVQSSSHAKSPRGAKSPTKRLSVTSKIPRSPKKSDTLLAESTERLDNSMSDLPPKLDTVIMKLSEKLDMHPGKSPTGSVNKLEATSSNSAKELNSSSVESIERMATLSDKDRVSSSPEHTYCMSEPKQLKEQDSDSMRNDLHHRPGEGKEEEGMSKDDEPDITVGTSFRGPQSSAATVIPSIAIGKSSAVMTTPILLNADTKTFPTTAGAYTSTETSVSTSLKTAGAVVSSLASPIEAPKSNSSTSRDEGSSNAGVLVEKVVGDVPLDDLLISLEEDCNNGTGTVDSVAVIGKVTDSPNTPGTSGSSTVTIPANVQAIDVDTDTVPQVPGTVPTSTDVGEPDGHLDGEAKLNPDAQESAAAPQMSKRTNVSKYAKLATKQEQIDDTDKFRIEESILLRTAHVAVSAEASEKIQLAIQKGKSFCLCSFCGLMKLSPEMMKEHLTVHVKDYFPFKCERCNFLSRKRGRVTVHMKSAHGGFLKCECCDYTTYDKDKLARHYKYWNRDFSNSCKFCHKKVLEGTKEEHLKQVHGKTAEEIASNSINLTADAFTCRHCGKKMKTRHARRDHEKRHEPHYLCPLCPYSTNGEPAFLNHGRKHRVIFVCCVCMNKFHSSHALKEHLREHAGPDMDVERLYERSVDQMSVFVASVLDEASIPECDIIGLDMGMRVKEEERRVSQQSSGVLTPRPVALPVTVQEMKDMKFGPEYDCYVKNIAYRHLSMPTLSFMFARYGKRECNYCGFLLHSLGSWKIHVGSHEGKRDFHCEECDYKCRHKFLLDRHILIMHKKQDFPCDICGKRFPYREYVYLHKRKDHDGGKMKCSFCTEVTFETEEEKVMKRHIIEEHPEMTSKQIAQIIGRKVHFTGKDGILFVKCKYCQKGFNRAAFLRQHVQMSHMQKKKFLCDQCGYKSNTKARLRTHMAVHTEVRDITCDECGAGFKNKVYLYKHIRRSHKRYATNRGADYCKRTRMKNVISLLQKERDEGSSYERQEIIQKEKAKLFGSDKYPPSVEGVGASQPTQINVFQCGDCGEYFENIFSLKNHFMFVHGESPNIPMDLEAAETDKKKGQPAPADPEQISIAMDALKNSSNSNTVDQLYQCAKCNRMFPDMKSIELHVKEVHATDVFLISEEGDIPSHELDLAAEVINHLTREAGQSGAVSMTQSVVSQSTIDALSMEAQNAATALTTLPDAVLEMGAQSELLPIEAAPREDHPRPTLPEEARPGADQVAGQGPVRMTPERTEEMEAAHLLQQMGVFQQQFSLNATSDNPVEVTPDTPVTISLPNSEGGTQAEDSVTIMVIEDDQKKA